MAHDIGFYDRETQKDIAFFFGYARGIFYEAFDAEECDAGMSGSNEGVTRTADQVRKGLEFIKSSDVYTSYPDPDRIKEVVEKLEAFLEQKPNGRVFIHYS